MRDFFAGPDFCTTTLTWPTPAQLAPFDWASSPGLPDNRPSWNFCAGALVGAGNYYHQFREAAEEACAAAGARTLLPLAK